MKKRNAIIIAAFLVLVLAVWAAFFLLPSPPVVTLEDEGHFVDLHSADFTGQVFRYRGYWENYPRQLYTAEDFATGRAGPPRQMAHEDYATVQYATHRVAIGLPKGRVYAITMRTPDYAMRIFINGEEVDAVGNPAATAEENVPMVAERVYPFVPTTDTTEIIVQASNHVHKEGAYYPVFTLGTSSNIDRYVKHSLMGSLIVLGGLVTSFLYHLGLFVLNRRRKAVLLFSICCLLLALMSTQVVPLFFATYNWYVVFQLEYLVNYLSFAALTLFLGTMFPGLYHKVVLRVYLGLCLLFALTTFLLPPRLYSQLMVYFQVVAVGMILYTLVRLAMGMRSKKAQNILAFVGVGVLALFASLDILARNGVWLGIGVGSSGQFFLSPLGMLFFVFCYGLVISIDFSETEAAVQLAKQREQQYAQQNQSLDRINKMQKDLMATVSHELRTPLAVMSGYAQLISRQMRQQGVGGQAAADLDKIASEAQRLTTLVVGAKTLALEHSTPAHEAVSLEEVIRQTAGLYAPILENKNTRLVVELEAPLPRVHANPDELTQVLFNLLSNAGNHTENGRVDIRARRQGHAVAVAVADTGCGMPPGYAAHAFEKGWHAREDGSGLGLSICRDIVRAHGGQITIESAPGQGTTVHFTLPAGEEENGELRMQGNAAISENALIK